MASEKISGAALFEKMIERPQSLFDFLWSRALMQASIDTPEGRAGLKMQLMEMAATIRHPDVRAQYRRMFLDRYHTTFGTARSVRREPAPTVVDMRAFAARRELTGDQSALLAKLSAVEDDLAEATRLLGQSFSDAMFEYQQGLMRVKAAILEEIAGS